MRKALILTDATFRLREFSALALKICSEQVYQQDWPDIRREFSDRSPRHKSLVDDLDIALTANAAGLRQSAAGGKTVKQRRSEE